MISFNQLNGQSVSDASGNTTLGTLSSQGAEFQRGLNNTAVGYGALRTNAPSSQHNTAVGLNALSNNTGSNNLAIGENALYNFPNPNPNSAQSGSSNVAIGNNAMQYNTVGIQNVVLGHQALNNNTTGFMNVAIGNNALQATSTGSENVAIGNQALNNNTTGNQNAVVGMGAGYYNTTGSNNAALGYNAMQNNTTGSDNVSIGNGALQANTAGNSHVAIGNAALQAHTSGDGNIAIGDFALATNTSGTDNVGIGVHTSSNNKSSCILLGNNAQALNDSEFAMGGINLIGPTPPLVTIAGYLPIRFHNYTIGGSPGTNNKQYYIPIYDDGSSGPLPVPEVIIANRSELDIGSGGVGLLIGFPSNYSAVTSVVIANGVNTYTITGAPSQTGYYVFYEEVASGFWPNIPSTYANLAQTPMLNSGLCAGVVFGNPLTFTYTIGSVTTTITYSPLAKNLDISDGYQYQQYNGQAAFLPASMFQWGGTGTGNPGSELWGEQVGTGTQTYTAWQGVSTPPNYQYNSIYKELYPFTSATAFTPMGSLTFGLGSRSIDSPRFESSAYSWIVNSSTLTLTASFPAGNTAMIGTSPGGIDVSSNANNGSPISITIQPSNRNTRYFMTVKSSDGTVTVGTNSAAVFFPQRLTQLNGTIRIIVYNSGQIFSLITNNPIPQDGGQYTATNGSGRFSGMVTLTRINPQTTTNH